MTEADAAPFKNLEPDPWPKVRELLKAACRVARDWSANPSRSDIPRHQWHDSSSIHPRL
jgi:hypothetical protein